MKDIEARAAGGLGRLAIPIYVKAAADARAVESSIRARHGAVVLDLQTIAYPDKLKETLERIFKARAAIL